MRRIEREQQWEAAHQLLHSLLNAHEAPFPEALHPEAPAPRLIDLKKVEKQARDEQLGGTHLWQRGARREAKQLAALRAAEKAEQLRKAAEAEHAARQRELDETWSALLANNPGVVLASIEHAFGDNEISAAGVDCRNDELTVVMVLDADGYLPERKPTVTDAGNLSLRKWSQKERNQHEVAIMASNAMATVKEAFAVALGIQRVRLLVVRKDEATVELGAVYHGVFSRSRFAKLDWNKADPGEELDRASERLYVFGRSSQLLDLDLSSEPELSAVLRHVAEALSLDPVGAVSESRIADDLARDTVNETGEAADVKAHDVRGAPDEELAPKASPLMGLEKAGIEETTARETGIDPGHVLRSRDESPPRPTFTKVAGLVDALLKNNPAKSPEELLAQRPDLQQVLLALGMEGRDADEFIRYRAHIIGQTPGGATEAGGSVYVSPDGRASMIGVEIRRRFEDNDHPPRHVGRRGGATGSGFREDLQSDAWRTRTYEVSYADDRPSRNWFSTREFVDETKTWEEAHV